MEGVESECRVELMSPLMAMTTSMKEMQIYIIMIALVGYGVTV